MITHVVLLKLKPGVTQQQIDAALTRIEELQKTISEILSVQIGKNLNEHANQGYAYGFIMQFATEDNLRIYAEHPVHQAAGRGLVEISESIIDFDLPS